jgi:PAS domain S-box-containing protein
MLKAIAMAGQRSNNKFLVDHKYDYKEIFEYSMDALLITEPDGSVLSANPAACRMFGQTKADIIRLGRNGLVDLSDKRLPVLLKKRVQDGKARGELNFIRKNGSVFQGEVSSVRFKGEQGQFLTIMIIRDITSRKQMEEELINSEKIFHNLFNTAEVGMFRARLDGSELINANQKFFEILGGKKEDMIGKPTDIHWLDIQQRNEMISRLKADGRVVDYECRILNKKKEIRYCLTSVNLNREMGIIDGSVIDLTDRKFTEDALKISEERLRMISEYTGQLIWEIDSEGLITYVNPFSEPLLGYRPEELIGRKHFHYFFPSKIKKKYIKSFFDVLADKGAIRKFESAFIHRDGRTLILETSGVQIIDKKGNLTGYRGTCIDVSQRKLIEDRMRESEERFRLLSEQSGIGIGFYSPEGKILYFNNRALANLGGKAEDYYGKSLIEVFGKKLGSEYTRRIRKVIKTGQSHEFEDSFSSPTGIYYFLSNHAPVYKPDGKIVGVQVLAHDLTRRKIIEKELNQANNYNRSLLEASLDPLVTIGPDGKILDVNKATQIATGHTRKELLGTDFSEYFTDAEKARDGYMEVFAKGLIKNYPLNIKQKDGNAIPVLYNATLFKDEKGNIRGVFATARDITVLKEAEEKLIHSASELRELTQHMEEIRENEKKEIAHDLHDDLGQKLTALNMDIAWLKARIGVRSKGVENKLDEMVEILNEALDSTKKISYGLHPRILDDLGLQAAIEWQLTEFNKSTGIKYHMSFAPKDLEINKKGALVVFRVVQETLTNVARHSQASEVILKLRTNANFLRLSLNDDGVGIKNHQINNPRSFGILGMRERVQTIGGNISIRTRQGKGTELNLAIPLINITP